MQIIDGKNHADKILTNLKSEVSNLATSCIYPGLAIILVGEDAASQIYINNKRRRAEEIGIKTKLLHLPTETPEEKLLQEIDNLNKDNNINGIIVQLPLPKHINYNIVQNAIDPAKDVDGFHPVNVGMLHSDIKEAMLPCTPQGCMYLINTICPDLTGKVAVVIGRSNIVGKPMAALLLRANATVIVTHSKTKDLAAVTNKADIVVSAIGKPLFLTKEYFKKDAIVIDVGISRIDGGKIAGDVDFENIKNSDITAITPVPGGVGPMTIAFLLSNVVRATQMQKTHQTNVIS